MLQTTGGPFLRGTWRLVGLLGAVLVGILAMHGLSAHGGASSGQHGVVPASVHLAPAGQEPAHVVATELPPVESGGSHDQGPAGGGDMVMLCLAFLVGLSIWGLVKLAAGHRWRWLPARPQLVMRVLPVRSRQRPPPSLEQLSILRC